VTWVVSLSVVTPSRPVTVSVTVYGLPETPVNPWLHMQGDYLRALVSGLLSLAALVAALLLGGAHR